MRVPPLTVSGPLAPLADFVRVVRSILSNGWTIADQAAGEVKTVRWREVAGRPLVVSTKLTTRPTTVLVLSAQAVPATGDVLSGLGVAWQWRGDTALRSIAISGITQLSSGEWDVTLWIAGG